MNSIYFNFTDRPGYTYLEDTNSILTLGYPIKINNTEIDIHKIVFTSFHNGILNLEWSLGNSKEFHCNSNKSLKEQIIALPEKDQLELYKFMNVSLGCRMDR